MNDIAFDPSDLLAEKMSDQNLSTSDCSYFMMYDVMYNDVT